MQTATIEMPKEEAKEAFQKYQAAVRDDRADTRRRWQREDEALARAYRLLSRGKKVLDLFASMRLAGLRDDGLPKLAICRADAVKCWLRIDDEGVRFATHQDHLSRWGRQATSKQVDVPHSFLPNAKRVANISTLVPMIPPDLRPKFNLANYHTLWEVDSWTPEPPKDPFLLQHLGGSLYAVVAVWDLTELERAVMRMTNTPQ